jgi:hypothetical protein
VIAEDSARSLPSRICRTRGRRCCGRSGQTGSPLSRPRPQARKMRPMLRLWCEAARCLALKVRQSPKFPKRFKGAARAGSPMQAIDSASSCDFPWGRQYFWNLCSAAAPERWSISLDPTPSKSRPTSARPCAIAQVGLSPPTTGAYRIPSQHTPQGPDQLCRYQIGPGCCTSRRNSGPVHAEANARSWASRTSVAAPG